MLNLTWNEFEKGASNTFKELLGETDFVDVTLVSDDLKQIKAHKVILSACSSIFKKMLQQNPQQQPIIYLTGVAYKEMQSMVNFMYLGQTEVDQDDLNHFMEVAAKFDVKGLSQEKQLSEVTTVDHLEEKTARDQWTSSEGDILQIDNTEIDSLYHNSVVNYDNVTEKPNLVKSEDNAYYCEQCNYKSEDASNMRRHNKAKHEGIKFPCDHCEYKSSFSHGLKRHKRSQHTS
eukprot:GFUD01118846.1.p1 GENE.GFUD01118846.1~~GFUD01118846.1.p1  ORF type:complete len:232 (-),score=64.25 GFUD01118846.1:83-778(-)